MTTIRGGEKLAMQMRKMAKDIGNGAVVRVGFLEKSKYPNGTPVAMIAAIQNYGAPSVGIPPRPFFSNMIADKQSEWPEACATQLRENGYDVSTALGRIGAAIAGQLRQSIIDTNTPPLSPVTIAKKGFDKPLIETSQMINSVDFEVVSKA